MGIVWIRRSNAKDCRSSVSSGVAQESRLTNADVAAFRIAVARDTRRIAIKAGMRITPGNRLRSRQVCRGRDWWVGRDDGSKPWSEHVGGGCRVGLRIIQEESAQDDR